MAFNLPVLPFEKDLNGTPHISVADDDAYRTAPSSQYFKKQVGEKNLWVAVSADEPLPVNDVTTQTGLASILAKIIASPATEAKQDALESKVDTLDAVVDGILTQLGTTGLKKIIDALPAGTNLLGKVGIDQTTPGVTNAISVSGSKMRQVDSIMGAFAVSTTAVSKTIADKNCTVHILSGNCWINPLATAVADATAIKLLSGMVLDLRVASTLSLISDATGASVQIVVWED